MDNIYDTLAKLDKVANEPEIVKEDNQAMMKKGLEDLIKKTKLNKQADYTPFSDKQSPDGLPEKKKDNKMFEKESDVERDDRAEKAGREVERDAKYDGMKHAGKDGKDVTKDIEYDEKHDKDGMHENAGTLKDAARQGVMARLAELAGLPVQEIEEALGTPQDVAAKIMAENPLDEDMKSKTFPTVFNDEDVIVANDPDSALELIADEVPEHVDMYMDAIRKGDYESLLDALDGFGYKMKYEEGNEFSGERDKAIKAGKDSFEVDGKTYPVKGDKKNEAIEEAEHDGMPSMKEMKACVDKGMTEAEICEKYSDCDQKKIKLMAAKCMNNESEEQVDEGAVKNMIQDVEEGMDKKEFEKKYPGQDYDEIKKEIEDRMDEEKVEETTSAGSVATSEGSDKPAFPNASIYEKYEGNEIAQRAFQINEGMNITVSAGSEQEPSINISAQGEEAAKLAQLLKLAGMGMAQPGYGEVQVEVAEDQEFANGADGTETKDAEYMTQDIAGGLNGPKKMAYPKVAGADNPMSVLGESELNEVSEDHLMKLYQEYKAK